jgi:hypothetical protein
VELATLIVNQVIIHQIPKVARKDKDTTGPRIADLVTPLDTRLQHYLRERITGSISRQSFVAVYDIPPPADDGDDPNPLASPIPRLVIEFFASDGENFVVASQEMGRYLYDLQSGTNSEGMLVLVDGTIGSGPNAGRCLAILKLEMSDALAIQERSESGKTVFDAEVRDITLQRKAQVFKAALFQRTSKLAELEPTVSDDQRDARQHGSEVATFFLRFLGCRLRETPERETKGYLEIVEKFVNDVIADPDLKKKVLMQTITDLSGNANTIDPQEVAERYLPVELQDAFVERFRTLDGSVPVLQKDSGLVNARLKTLVADFSGNIKVTGPADSVNKALQPGPDGWRIDAELRHIGPK